MRHLDDLLYQQLTASGGLVDPEIRAHLLTDCETCATYLANRPRADALDGRVDAALLANRSSAVPLGELERILARVERPRPLRALLGVAAALLAVTAAGLGLHSASRLRSSSNDIGIKGDAPITVSTSFAIVGANGLVHSGSPGMQVIPTDALSLRLELSREARISVVRVDGRGSEVILENEPTPAGTRDLRRDGQLVGIPMAGLTGEQRLQVVASNHDLLPAELEALARGTLVPGAAVGGISVRVAP